MMPNVRRGYSTMSTHSARSIKSTSSHVAFAAERRSRHLLYTLWRFCSSGVIAPASTTYDPMVILLNADDRAERDALTGRWRDNKLRELNFVGVVSALLAGCLTSTNSWPDILPNGIEKPWAARTAWYCGIVFAMASILGAADQTIRLHRLSAHRDALPLIRHLISGGRRDAEGKLVPRRMQCYTWQLPVLFLMLAVVCMLTGIFVMVWSAVRQALRKGWWDGDANVAIVFTVVSFVTGLVFFAGQLSLFSPLSEIDLD